MVDIQAQLRHSPHASAIFETGAMQEKGTIVDLFCGCGGFSLGAELAGFQSIAAIDIEPILQSGYRRNFPRSRAIEGSVKDIDIQDWQRIIGHRRPDGVIGGPPCQGFSWIGKRLSGDPRNSLVLDFVRHVNILNPKFFIMENVEGILHNDKVDILTSAFETLSCRYRTLSPIIINAAHFGAPTNRHRVIIVGYNPDDVDAIDVESIASVNASSANIRDAISDLPNPCPAPRERGDMGWARYPRIAAQRLSPYARMLRTPPPPGLGSPEAIEMLQKGFVSGLTETRHSPQIANRYTMTVGGKCDPITKSYKLTWDGVSPTLRAGTGSEKGAFQAVRPLHPEQGRVITVREAARIQGFPDWFLFHPTKWHSFRMIGNSVSPIVSRALFEYMAGKLGVRIAA